MSCLYLLLLDSADAAPQKSLYYKSQTLTREDMKKCTKTVPRYVSTLDWLLLLAEMQGLGKLFWKWYRCSGKA